MGKRTKKEKLYNAGTFTEAMLFSWLRSRLRRLSIYWKPIQQVKKEARIPYRGPNKRRKFSYVCGECGEAVPDKECAVHHIVPAGSLKSFEDLPGFCRRLFVEKEGLILLCNNCHERKHRKD